MPKSYMSVITIEETKKIFHFAQMYDGDKKSIFEDKKSFKAKLFESDFYTQLGNALNEFQSKYPTGKSYDLTLVLPDNCIITDLITVPTIGMGNAIKNAVNVSINGMYKNKKDLRIKGLSVSANKQFTTWAMVMVREEYLTNIKNTCINNKVSIKNITYYSNAIVNAICVLKPKLKLSTFILLDIKESSSKIIFVIKGRTICFYTLPFGYGILEKNRLASEDMLFNHQVAELACLNAREKAKAQELTMLDEDDEESEVTDETKSQVRKVARKLPKFMQREIPNTEEGICYENFRLILKWTLDVIRANDDVTTLGTFDTVYCNMPYKYEFLYELVNKESEENKVKFVSLLLDENELINNNLELFGAFYSKQFNKINNF